MMTPERYREFISQTAPRSKHAKTMFFAFLIGGLICCLGQGVSDLFKAIFPYASEKTIGSYVTVAMIFLGGLATGIGVYDDLGNLAGGGSIVPITGFANSIVAPAMEYKKEGVIFGICSNLFAVSGPIIVLGVFASFFSGIVALLFT